MTERLFIACTLEFSEAYLPCRIDDPQAFSLPFMALAHDFGVEETDVFSITGIP
jgi:hypothetical protein